MEKEFVSYEQAVALKELGFDYDCFGWYGKDKSLYDTITTIHEGLLLAPLKQQVVRWFREKYDAHMHPTLIMPNAYMVRYGLWTSKVFSTFEEAENACIDKLIELAKQQSITDDALSKEQDK